MTGKIAYVDKPLYHITKRPESLTTSETTGMGSPARKEVRGQFEKLYSELFEHYTNYLAGFLDIDALRKLVCEVGWRYITPEDQQELRAESYRFRKILNSAQESPRFKQQNMPALPVAINQKKEVKLVQHNGPKTDLIDDPRLTWNEWTITRSTAVGLTERLNHIKPKSILEIGSGLSTVLLAHYAANHHLKVTSLEHEKRYYQHTIALLKMFGLTDCVQLRLAPLTLTSFNNDATYFWYNTKLNGKFDFVFVDGPPERYGRAATLFALAQYLAPEAELWLHDGHRQHEKDCLEIWEKDFQFSSFLWEADRGVWLLSGLEKIKHPKMAA
ncbi:MAG: class I SAM-dependent methyltransferase [Anaerolineae bacterium]